MWDVLFYHELYHHFEDIKRIILENAGITYEVKPLPFIKKKISPESAGEIAAYEFARQMQKIDFHPYILGIIGLYAYKKETAEKIIEDIMKLSIPKRIA